MARVHYAFDPERKYIRHDPDKMPEREFPGGDMLKLLSMTSIQLALLRHADRVKIGCMTGGLAALATSNHDTVWRPATYYAFRQLIDYARGTSLQVAVDSETFDMPGYAIDDTSQYTGKNNVNYIDSAAAWDEKTGRLAVFVINRNEKSEYPLDLDVRAFEGFQKVTRYEMFSKDFEAKSSAGHDWKTPAQKSVTIKEGIASTKLKPLSWNVFIFV